MARYLSRDRAAIAAALAVPLLAAALLLPFRSSWSNTNVALLMVVAVVAVSTIGNRVAGAVAAVCGLPGQEVELRVFGNGQYYGRFMLQPGPGSRPPLQARLVAVTLADLAGRALGSA